MVQEKIKEESKLTYDDRRKILIQKKSQVTKNNTEEVKADEEKGIEAEAPKLVSTVNQNMEVEYTEEGIKLAYKGLIEEKGFHDKKVIDIKAKLKKAGEMTPELTKLKEDIDKLTEIEVAKKQAAELEAHEERLKEVNKEIKEIKTTIGSRLKL